MNRSDHPELALVATTISGLEEVLAEELRQLGAREVKVMKRAVSFTGPLEVVYRANLWCRIAFHILRLITSFPVRTQKELYDRMYEVRWEDWMESDQTLAVHAVAHQAVFTHTRYAEQLSKDAIADRFRARTGRRPSVDLDAPFLQIHLHLAGEVCQVFVDSSGDSLHKRGYRSAAGPAPLNEVLAAGLIRLTGWDGKTPFFDPMCGSGTLLTEAALIGLNLPPGRCRKNFNFRNWPDHNEKIWNEVNLPETKPANPPPLAIQGADIAERMVHIARENLKHAGLEGIVYVSRRDFWTSDPPWRSGMLITNPPYGQRLPVDDLHQHYRHIGDVLKNRYADWTAWILASDKQALKFLGLKPSRKITLFNGPLECKFVNFEVFEGRRKNMLKNKHASNGTLETE
ncbi:MAG: THUMP domain-containing protein [Bacteroidales bacterium]|nr:THUMP domain-containing protein [Bacteroidales bacterium]